MSYDLSESEITDLIQKQIAEALGDSCGGWRSIRNLIDEQIAASNAVKVGIRLFRKGAILPTRGTEHSAGWDIYAFIDNTTGSDWSNAPGCIAGDPEIDGGKTLIKKKTTQITIPAGEMRNVKTGINFRIPEGYEVQIRPRSGLAFKNQVTIMNSPGTIDADYDGDSEAFELNMMVMNHGKKDIVIEHGMRIGQMVVSRVLNVQLEQHFDDNPRRLVSARSGGLGHTGLT